MELFFTRNEEIRVRFPDVAPDFMKKLKVNKFWKRYQRERLKKFGITQKDINERIKQLKVYDF